MVKREQQLPENVASLSIDHWQNDEPVKGTWLDNPIWGALVMCCAGVVLCALTALVDTNRSSNRRGLADIESESPTPLRPSDPGTIDEMMREVKAMHSPGGETASGVAADGAAQPKANVSELITKLIEADQNGSNRYEIQQELSSNGCDNVETARRLIKRLRDTVNAKDFEKIMLAINRVSYVISDNPDMKRQFVQALSAAGQHVQASQLKMMDQRVLSLILNSTQLPESGDLLGKLASTDDEVARAVLAKVSQSESELASEMSVKIVRENSIDPWLLRDKDSDVVCEYLWEGKLAGKEEFSSVSVGNSAASIRTFSSAAAAQIANDPSGAVDSLMALSLHRSPGFDRKSLPKELVQKIDSAISTNVQKYFVDSGEIIYEAQKRGKKGTGPIAFLDLAKHLGGRKTVIAIAKAGESDPSILQKFVPIRDLLLSVNEPETYDAIALATAFHGIGRSSAIEKKIGQAIEPNFVQRLQVELQSKPTKKEEKDWVERVRNLLEVIEQIGTAQSVPVLGQLAENKNSLLKKTAAKILKKIGPSSVATAKPTKTKLEDPNPTDAIETGTIKVSTDSGEAFRSSINNIVQGKISRSSIHDKLAFNPKTMWHSSKLESGWATVELEFPERVTLDKIQIYSRHTGKNHPVVAAKVFAVDGRSPKLLVAADDLKQRASLRFKSTKSKKWKLELQAGKSKKVVVRGLRFFDGKRELYPPSSLPSSED